MNKIASQIAMEAFEHISTPVPDTSSQWIVEGRQSEWVPSCNKIHGISILTADCFFTAKNLHFNLYRSDKNLDW